MNENEKLTTDEVNAAPMGEEQEQHNNILDTPQDAQSSLTDDILNDPAIKAYIEKQVAEGIQKALKGTPPKANTANPTEQEKKQFEKMTYKERLNLFKSNPQAYNKFTKGINRNV